MFFTTVQFNKYISIALLLLMFAALAAGQAGATIETDETSVEIVAEPDHFRSEDE